MNTKTYDIQNGPHDGKKVFRKLGTCSRTFCHILNREFGHTKTLEERAADALAGGILQKGHQCGMLWGASLAIGAEAYRSTPKSNLAIPIAIKATQSVMASFKLREGTVNCRDITRCDFSNKWSYYKYMFSGRFLHCFNLAQEWAPEAVRSAAEALANEAPSPHTPCHSCATTVARKMGATEEQAVMVAGFAGGLGLSGQACGALSAALWMRSLEWYRNEQKDMTAFKDPRMKAITEHFDRVTGKKILCSEITGNLFKSTLQHSRFIQKGGCAELLDALAKA